MNPDKNAFKAGLFIVVAILLGAGFLVLLQGTRGWFEPMRTVTAVFDLDENLGGLKAGDPVRVGGFDQGRVKAVRYESAAASAGDAGRPHMEVEFTLPQKYDLRVDAVVTVEQALTGTANLNLTDFGRQAKWTDATPLDGQPSAIGTLYALAPELRGFVADLRSKVGPGYARYDQTLATAGEAAGSAKQAMRAFTDFLGGSGPDLHQTLANMNHATETLNARLPKTLDKADAFIDDTRQTLTDARAVAADARVAIADARVAMATARDTLNDVHGLVTRNRSRIDNILASVRTTTANLEGASAEIRRSPWRLLYQPSKDEVANVALFDATRQFAQAAAQLNDAAGAVRDAAAEPGVDRKQVQALLDDLQQTFGKYRQVEQVLWQSVK